mgnify:FL=1
MLVEYLQEEKGEEMSEVMAFTCRDIGVSGTTKVYVQQWETEFEARVGIALLGCTNMKDSELENANPFAQDFRDNYARGVGKTQEEALENLKKEVGRLSEMLFG